MAPVRMHAELDSPMKPGRAVVWWLGLVAAAVRAWSAEPQYSSHLWQMEDGLPHNIVQAIAQTPDGYLWVGTREGLARFDGVQFREVESPSALSHASITCLLARPDGDCWIGTEKNGMFRWHNRRFQCCVAPGQQTNYTVHELLCGSNGVIWAASSAGVLQWKEEKLSRLDDFLSLIRALCVDTNGTLWMAGATTLKRLGTPEPLTLTPRTGTLPDEVRRAYCDRNGVFWITSTDGIVRLHDGVATWFPKAAGPSGFVSRMLLDRAGVLWIGSYAGLSRFEDGRFLDEGDPDERSYHIFTLFEDREGDLWVGSEEGLARLTPRRFRTYTRRQGLTLNTVVTTCASRDGSLWIGAWGGGINHLVDGQFSVLGAADGLSSEFVTALHEGRDGSLWIGTDYGHALNRLKDGHITQYGRAEGYAGGITSALFEDPAGRLWVGTREGLQCLDDGKFQSFPTSLLSHSKINALDRRLEGGFWIGTEGGLTYWDQGQFVNLAATNSRLRASILSLYQDPQRVLWIGTRGQGMLRFKEGAVARFTAGQGLASEYIYSILEDSRNHLWLNSSRGIFRVSKAQLDEVAAGLKATATFITYGKADGVLSTGQYGETVQPSACKDSSGHLWFRTTQGVVAVDPETITLNEQPPPVVIEEVIADRKTVAVACSLIESGRATPRIGPCLPPEISPPIDVPPGRGELEVRYTALSFRAPEKNRFKYKLESVDSDWIEAGTRRSAHYNNLRPGYYRFLVAACNNDGFWNERGSAVSLRLLPHFWQTWWFSTLTVAACLGAVAGTVRYVTRKRMQRKLERLEQQHAIEKERTRIAQDMHDELGAKLTRITFLGATANRALARPAEAQAHIEKMSQTARQLVSSLDEIVWAVDPANDFLDSLASYICRHATEFFEDSPVRCQLSVPPTLPRRRLPTDVRHNVFLAVKEALNNVLKHSGASEVELTIHPLPQGFEILISDNGRGFDPASPIEPARGKRAGHGLNNLRERMQLIQGACELISHPGQGTRLRLYVPLAEQEE